VCGTLLLWLQRFFSDRTCGTSLSSVAHLLSGVVQGSGIGPIAFIIYIDHLVKLTEQSGIHVKVFADDMKVYIELSDVQCTVKLQDVLNLIAMWAADWLLQISVTKTNILNIGSTEHAVDYYMGNTVLPVVTTCRDLGITVTNHLAPSQHINDITVKAHQRANSILRCFVTKDTAVLLRACTPNTRI